MYQSGWEVGKGLELYLFWGNQGIIALFGGFKIPDFPNRLKDDYIYRGTLEIPKRGQLRLNKILSFARLYN